MSIGEIRVFRGLYSAKAVLCLEPDLLHWLRTHILLTRSVVLTLALQSTSVYKMCCHVHAALLTNSGRVIHSTNRCFEPL
jgi:hypothetical protein